MEYADGLHIGQDDIRAFDDDLTKAVDEIRAKIGRKILGLSTHNKKEILEANTLDIDYIGLGAYRETSTKAGVYVAGKTLLDIAKHSNHPVGIIGGVTLKDNFEKHIAYRVIGSSLYV